MKVMISEGLNFNWLGLTQHLSPSVQMCASSEHCVSRSHTTLVTLSTQCVQAMNTVFLGQGGVTPIESIVTAATAGQSFDRLFSAV